MLPLGGALWGGTLAWMERCFGGGPLGGSYRVEPLKHLGGSPTEWEAALRHLAGLLRWFVLYAAEPGGGMFHHIDRHETSAWQAQVAGEKRWHLCSPDQAHLM